MSDVPVDDELPDSPMHTTGTDHITIWGSNAESVLDFYRDLLGMRVVLRQPNLDDPDQTHLFLDTGDGRIITFFVSDDRPANRRPQQTTTGGVHHLAFSVDPEEFQEVKAALEADGRGYNEFDRGIFHSLYTRDNDGLIIELAADKYEIPEDRRADVLVAAQRHREQAGAEYAKEEHMEAALEELGIEVDPHDLSEAASGVGGVE
ncbi:VOC family protein [Salinirussus salinus]|jgi:catechol 2,3-dioxygenase-like lactoylglutathione lyase family enzyme|uniref:VOC family protein n=1 Tax=Salinirussus salinus TaxID=1198300 RepID=UPI00135B4B73|nr:VOC family protein [Salinirussus salinus]